MKIRPAKPEDIPALTRLYEEMGFDYVLPDLASPEFASVMVVTDEQDQPVIAMAARKTVELFMLLDQNWESPKWRSEASKALFLKLAEALREQGYTDVHAWVPQEIARSFGRRLMRIMGWLRAEWPCFWTRITR